MTLSLYAAIVPNFIQTVEAVAALVDKAEAFCAEQGCVADEIVKARFAPDMNPFDYQVKSVSVHSRGAIAGVRAGAFSPDTTTPPDSFAGMKDQLAATVAELRAMSEDEINGLVGTPVVFRFGEREMPFDAENFLLSFSFPNFYFHATTAYDLMRWKGVQIGKRDFMGMPRIRR